MSKTIDMPRTYFSPNFDHIYEEEKWNGDWIRKKCKSVYEENERECYQKRVKVEKYNKCSYCYPH